MAIRCLIVDDEALAREKVRQLLREERDVEVVGECGDGVQALEPIRALAPDLVFLDVRMPGIDGFAVLAGLEPPRLPAVVFVTAYDEYALRAFDVHAVDYLLKPLTRPRFRQALERVRRELQRGGGVLQERLVGLLKDLRPDSHWLERLLIRSGGRLVLVKVDDIDWIDGAGNYLKLHVGRETHLLRHTMGGLEARLDPGRFLRVHRSTIVNLDRVAEFQPSFSGDYVVVLKGGTRLAMGRSYRGRLADLQRGGPPALRA